jgi:hypothetical protein
MVGLEPGQIPEGDLFNEPMRFETETTDHPEARAGGLSGLQSEKFRRVRHARADLTKLRLRCAQLAFDRSSLGVNS